MDADVETGPSTAAAAGGAADPIDPVDAKPARRTYKRGRRSDLIEVAADLFMHNPFEAVTVEMIAARAGITGPGLYRHFSNKQALLIAVLEEPTLVVREAARRIGQSTAEPRQALNEMVDAHLHLTLKGPPSTLIFARSEHALPEQDRRRIRREMALYAEEWVSVLRPLRPDLSEPEVRLLAQSVFAMLNTAAMLRKGLDEASVTRTMREAAIRALIGEP